MSEAFYTARSSVQRVEGLHRRGTLEDGTTLEFGVHGGIAEHYGVEPEREVTTTIDYVIAAAGG